MLQEDLSEPSYSEDLDGSSGVLFPFYDPDTHMLYVAGKVSTYTQTSFYSSMLIGLLLTHNLPLNFRVMVISDTMKSAQRSHMCNI